MTGLGLSLEEHGDKPVRALSGGMLQKALLALAVAEEAQVLLLDEPTANLDPRARADFVRDLRNVPPHTTVVLSSHRLEDVRAAADRVLVLHDGRLAFDGPLENLLEAEQAAHTVWITTREVDRALRTLERDGRVQDLFPNGVRVGVRVRPCDIADLLAGLRLDGIPVDGVSVESPALEALLEGPTAAGTVQGGQS
jgi:ABC-2 type transport system ATP-binding protein